MFPFQVIMLQRIITGCFRLCSVPKTSRQLHEQSGALKWRFSCVFTLLQRSNLWGSTGFRRHMRCYAVDLCAKVQPMNRFLYVFQL
ncbi:hypothetical protein PsorP6_018887 [Peronosclerospora sorghi]|nr:hypothetical protein PsorP6_018907 [Peronosclerospora sorghi]KAI9895559.1 hypothetical protein PsorP6_018887 [Peronosclerospora sorghi]